EGILSKRSHRLRSPPDSDAESVFWLLREIHNYLLCQDKWTLLYMVNLGCIELNPWLSRISHLECPDYSVIDIDPDDHAFKDVVKVALEVRAALKQLG